MRSSTPVPPIRLHATLARLPKGLTLHRVHQKPYRARQFNDSGQGNARFSPIRDAQDRLIPTLYGGTTMDCALMETIFHDVPHTAGFKSFDKHKLIGQVHSTIVLMQSLQVIDLSSIYLRKLGITRKQLIDTEKEQYPATRRWAEALYSQYPDAQGFSWVSRQDDSARAIMLFGNRIPNSALKSQGASRSLLDDDGIYDAVLSLAGKIGVAIVPGM